MPDARQTFDHQYLEMRWRCLSLAADLDRIDRAGGLVDPRLDRLKKALDILTESEPDRAGRVQKLLSDPAPLPSSSERK